MSEMVGRLTVEGLKDAINHHDGLANFLCYGAYPPDFTGSSMEGDIRLIQETYEKLLDVLIELGVII